MSLMSEHMCDWMLGSIVFACDFMFVVVKHTRFPPHRLEQSLLILTLDLEF